jgi:hypothetical protein
MKKIKKIIGAELWEILQGLLGALFFLSIVSYIAYSLVY